MRTLTAKQERFVSEYLVDLNATQAAIRAGYSAKTAEAAASRLLRNVNVKTAVHGAMEKLSSRTEVTQEYVINNLLEVVERCMQRAPVMVRQGRVTVQATDDEGRHVWAFNGKVSVSALHLLGKHLGMFKDLHEHSGPDGGPIDFRGLTDDQLRERIHELEAGITPRAGRNGTPASARG